MHLVVVLQDMDEDDVSSVAAFGCVAAVAAIGGGGAAAAVGDSRWVDYLLSR